MSRTSRIRSSDLTRTTALEITFATSCRKFTSSAENARRSLENAQRTPNGASWPAMRTVAALVTSCPARKAEMSKRSSAARSSEITGSPAMAV